jgi:Flp pilus assembly CpaF family ATPase
VHFTRVMLNKRTHRRLRAGEGRIERVADRLFEGEEAVLHVIERIVAPLGLRVDATSPWVDARLPDGSRVQTRFLRTPFS